MNCLIYSPANASKQEIMTRRFIFEDAALVTKVIRVQQNKFTQAVTLTPPISFLLNFRGESRLNEKSLKHYQNYIGKY